ncbi:MAG: HNH endonuclease signature motif containing protein [Nitrososphaeraceae archaeon]
MSSSNSLSPSTASEFPAMANQGDQASFGVAIIVAILVIISCVVLAIRKLITRGKHRERQHFSDSVKESVLKKQNHKCARCKHILNVVDWDHKNGDRSNNSESNCQALCPNCHAIKTRSNRK